MIQGWTLLRPSVRERQLQVAALAAALAVTCALTLAALLADPRHPGRLWAATLACAAIAVACAWRLRPARGPALEVAIDAHGAPLLRVTGGVTDGIKDGITDGATDGVAGREAADDPSPAARCVFAAPWLITLRCGALRAPVWPDSMPADAFRRLHACVRWGSPAPDAGRPAAPDPS